MDEEDTSGWLPIQTSDGQKLIIHPEDLDEAKRRDPGLKTLDYKNNRLSE